MMLEGATLRRSTRAVAAPPKGGNGIFCARVGIAILAKGTPVVVVPTRVTRQENVTCPPSDVGCWKRMRSEMDGFAKGVFMFLEVVIFVVELCC